MDDKKKEGISVKDLEGYAKKHRHEFFFLLLFILCCLFSIIFWGARLSVFLVAIGGIVGVFLSHQVQHYTKKFLMFVFKQEKTTQLIIGIVGLIVAIFVAPLIFLIIGLQAGACLIMHCREMPHQPHK